MTDTSQTLEVGNADERDAILASIRRNLAESAPFDAVRREHRGHGVAVSRTMAGQAFSCAELIQSFRSNLESVGAYFTLAADEAEAAVCVASVIGKIGARNIAVSDSDLIKRLVVDLAEVTIVENSVGADLFDCDLGITGAQWGIAETGTLVLESDIESHRLTSLVPPVHLCVLKADRIRQTLGEILNLTSKELSRTITFITGASRTSDIELTLAIGVHGPGELHVIVVAD